MRGRRRRGGDREVGPPADPLAAAVRHGTHPRARQTTTEETFLIERIPVRFVVVILVLPSEGSAVVGRERWLALSSRARASHPGPVAEGGVEWLAQCLSEGERKILLVFQFHRILLNITLSDSDFEVRGRKEGMDGGGRADSRVAAKMVNGAEVVPL